MTSQAERLLAWAAAWPERTWAVEGGGGLARTGRPAHKPIVTAATLPL
jgi:hypothetical protein